MARRIHKRPEQITRLLGAPGNWTLDTVSDLLLGMGFEPELSAVAIANAADSKPEETAKRPDEPPFPLYKVGTPAASEPPEDKFDPFSVPFIPGNPAQQPILAPA